MADGEIPQVAPAPLTPEELAAHLEWPLIHPTLTEEQVAARVETACHAGLRAVIVRPSDVDLATRHLEGKTLLAVLCGFPFGYATTSTKVFEAKDAIRRGARRIDVAVNIGKLQSRQFQFVEMELIQLAQACHEAGARLRAIFETPLLGEEQRLVISKVSKRSETDEALASFRPVSADEESLLLKKCTPLVAVAGARLGLDAVLEALPRFTSLVVDDAASVVDQYRARLEAAAAQTPTESVLP